MKQYLKSIVIRIISWQAKKILVRHNPFIIMVTGSAGKTGTKDAIFCALSKNFYIRKSEKSFNSEIGIPLTILGLGTGWDNPFSWFKIIVLGFVQVVFQKNYPTHLVLEADTRTPGDLTLLTQWVKPNIVVITSFGDTPAHIERFDSKDALLHEQLAPVRALHPEGCVIVFDQARAILDALQDLSRTVITYGEQSDSAIVLSQYHILQNDRGPSGITFRVDGYGSSLPVTLHNTLGKGHAYAVTAGLAVAMQLDLNTVPILEQFNYYTPTQGRLHIVPGIKNTTIIDDTYNASPDAMMLALDTLDSIVTPHQKIAVLGDMFELGKHSDSVHTEIGKKAGMCATMLITVGIRSRMIAEGALQVGFSEAHIFQFDEAREAGKFLESKITSGDIILVKGSQGMRMERAVKEIMADPASASIILVRQEDEWMKR